MISDTSPAGILPLTSDSLLAPALPRRMACWLYEGVLLFGVVFIAGYLFSALSQSRNALDNRHPLMAFLFVVLGIYFVWFWTRGQTLAMKTWHIRVVDRHRRPLSQPRALMRYFASWLWFLPPLAASMAVGASSPEAAVLTMGWGAFWALASRLHPQRQFLHDILAGTRLITFRPEKQAR